MQFQRISQSTAILIVGIFIAIFHNFAFFRNISDFYSSDENLALILISIGFLHAGIIIILLSLLGTGKVLKHIIALLLLISSFTAYFSDNFNVIIDQEMLVNVIQTDPREAFDLITPKFLAYFLLLGFVPIILLYKTRFTEETLKTLLLKRAGLIAASVVIILLTVYSNSDFFASFLREQKVLKAYANPTKTLESIFRMTSSMLANSKNEVWQPIALDAHKSGQDTEFELVVLVIGETARAENFSLNGYTRKTNPKLEQQDVISFSHVQSCGTTTAVSLPCMFSILDREDYNRSKATTMDNLLDVLKRSGVSILWRDNNSGSKSVADRVDYQPFISPDVNPVCDIECRDEGMLSGLDEWLDQHPETDMLIVMHQSGSHGPAYYKRYPSQFEMFQPTCKTNQLDQCTKQQILNTYDNTILYTDYFLEKVINWLKQYKNQYEVSMLYVSDHGESLGESGLYLHGFPFLLAPENQTHVPAILWGADNNEDIDFEKVNTNRSLEFSHDNLFHTLLGLFEIHTQSYQPDKDILQYQYHYEN